MIEEYKNLKIADFCNKTPKDLQEIYKDFIVDAEKLYVSQNDINLHKDTIHAFTVLITVFHNIFTDKKNKSQKEILRGYLENLQIHLTRLQQQYNQLTYEMQFKKNEKYFLFAIIVAIISFFLSVVSIAFTIYYGEAENTIFTIKISFKPLEKENDFYPKDTSLLIEKIDTVLLRVYP
jgi:hypothetical protein